MADVDPVVWTGPGLLGDAVHEITPETSRTRCGARVRLDQVHRLQQRSAVTCEDCRNRQPAETDDLPQRVGKAPDLRAGATP